MGKGAKGQGPIEIPEFRTPDAPPEGEPGSPGDTLWEISCPIKSVMVLREVVTEQKLTGRVKVDPQPLQLLAPCNRSCMFYGETPDGIPGCAQAPHGLLTLVPRVVKLRQLQQAADAAPEPPAAA